MRLYHSDLRLRSRVCTELLRSTGSATVTSSEGCPQEELHYFGMLLSVLESFTQTLIWRLHSIALAWLS